MYIVPINRLRAALAEAQRQVAEARANMRDRIRESEQDAKVNIRAYQSQVERVKDERDEAIRQLRELTAQLAEAQRDAEQGIHPAERALAEARAMLRKVREWLARLIEYDHDPPQEDTLGELLDRIDAVLPEDVAP